VPILTIGYGHPADTEVFDCYYETQHRRLAEKLPHIIEMTVHRCSSLNDSPAPYHLLAQLRFGSEDDLKAALASPAGQSATADLANFATGGVTLFVQQ
jgi:uncharacterized protein (TIGR02118 family)